MKPGLEPGGPMGQGPGLLGSRTSWFTANPMLTATVGNLRRKQNGLPSETRWPLANQHAALRSLCEAARRRTSRHRRAFLQCGRVCFFKSCFPPISLMASKTNRLSRPCGKIADLEGKQSSETCQTDGIQQEPRTQWRGIVITTFLVLRDLKGRPRPPKRPDHAPGGMMRVPRRQKPPSPRLTCEPLSRRGPQGWKAGSDDAVCLWVYVVILLLLLRVFKIISPLCEDHQSLTTSRNTERLGTANPHETSHTRIWALPAVAGPSDTVGGGRLPEQPQPGSASVHTLRGALSQAF